MTTIAWDGHDLAADGQTTGENTIMETECKKIYDVGGGYFLGAAGAAVDCELVAKWIRDGEDPKAKPMMTKKGGNFEALLIAPDGECTWFTNDLNPVPFTAPQAIGSGWKHAFTAMKLGLTATEAVKVSCELDVNTGGKIQTVHIKQRKRKR